MRTEWIAAAGPSAQEVSAALPDFTDPPSRKRKHLALLALVAAFATSAMLIVPVPAGAASFGVSMTGIKFVPPALTVHVGDTVKWTNNDGPIPHTVTATSGASFDSGVFSGGETYSRTFSSEGLVSYRCNVHPTMTGTVDVVAAATTTTGPGTATTVVGVPGPKISTPPGGSGGTMPRTGGGRFWGVAGLSLLGLAAAWWRVRRKSPQQNTGGVA